VTPQGKKFGSPASDRSVQEDGLKAAPLPSARGAFYFNRNQGFSRTRLSLLILDYGVGGRVKDEEWSGEKRRMRTCI